MGKLHYFSVCKDWNESLVKYLVDHSTNINIKNINGKPLFNECKNGNEVIVKYLVGHRVNINIENYDRETLLFNECLSK